MNTTNHAHLETVTTPYQSEYENDDQSRMELGAPRHLELAFPTPDQYDTFDIIMRCDAATTPEFRLIDPTLAHDVLLDTLQRASDVRKRANAFDPHDHITEAQLLDAYCDGVDAYAGLLTLAPSHTDSEAMEGFYEWSRLAAGAVQQAESRGISPSTNIFRTPASLVGDWNGLNDVRQTLDKRAQFERTKQYWKAAQQQDSQAIQEAFIGSDATILNRAKALFTYAHGLPEEATDLKVACLEEAVVVIHDAVTRGDRPHEEDLVSVYEYFMLESMLGRSVHDIVWLDGHDTDDNRARRLSVLYLTNATDALEYVKRHLISSQVAPERALHDDMLAFHDQVLTDQPSVDARATIDFLAAGLKELRIAEGALLDITNDPHEYPDKEPKRLVAEKRVTYLKAKAAYEQIAQRLAEQQEVLHARLDTMRAEHSSITERQLAMRFKHIGDIRPGTYGNRVAHLVLDIDQQLNEARYFASIYDAECKEMAQQTYELEQQLGLSVMRLLQTLQGIEPDDESMDASRFRTPAELVI